MGNRNWTPVAGPLCFFLVLVGVLVGAAFLVPSAAPAALKLPKPPNPKDDFIFACSKVASYSQKEMKRKGESRPLTPWQSYRLKLFFGDHIQGVEFRFNAKLSQFKVNGKVISGPKDIQGRQFGNTVYVKNPQWDRSLGQLSLLAHEMVHILQERQGVFPEKYCRAVWDAKLKYEDIKYEREAYAIQAQFDTFQKSVPDEVMTLHAP